MTAVDHAHVATLAEVQEFWADGIDINLPILPVRTTSACHKLTSHGICACVEFVDGGPKIGRDTEPSCARCLDTRQSHQTRKIGQKVRR